MPFTFETFYAAEFEAHASLVTATRAACAESFASLLAEAEQTIRQGGKLLFFGNGGSAADAQHLAAELIIRYRLDRNPIAAMALSSDAATLTAGANDLGFEQIFARQILAIGQPGDLAIGISTSGQSPNVIAGLNMAQKCGLKAAGFGAGTGGAMQGLAVPLLRVPSETTARIQEMHILLGHMLCSALEQRLELV